MGHIQRFNKDSGKFEIFHVVKEPHKSRGKKGYLKKFFKFFILGALILFFILSIVYIMLRSGLVNKHVKKTLNSTNLFIEYIT